MPPRRSARHAVASVRPVAVRSAARTAYSIIEIRREILQLLAPPDLARFMRVERGCMEEVAKELYGKISVANAESISSVDPMYIEAVRHIDARSMYISSAMRELLCWEDWFPEDSMVHGYDVETFNYIVPYLRERYTCLRRIELGMASARRRRHSTPEHFDSWAVVTFDAALDADSPRGPTAWGDGGYQGELGGHIMCYWMEHCLLLDDNVTELPTQFPEGPKGNYTIQHRFDAHFTHYGEESPSPEACESWRTALRKAPGFENLYAYFRTTDIFPIPLDLLTHLYERQIAAGHVERLQKIHIEAILPWKINEFASFAKVASTLTSLDICGNDFSFDYRPVTSFRDLSTFVSLVRTHIPHLSKLALDLDGGCEAEEICRGQLTEDSLASGGTIKDLRIIAGKWESGPLPTLFNTIRVLAGMCAPEAYISISKMSKAAPWENNESAHLQYLLRYVPRDVSADNRQPLHCRRHLATRDFAAWGMTKLRQVLLLDYKADGTPFLQQKRCEADRRTTTQWLEEFAAASRDMDEMDQTKDECEGAFERLNEIAAVASAREKKLRAEQLVELMVPLKAKLDKLSQSLDVEAVRKFIEGLQL